MSQTTATYHVTGMTCDHCVSAVTEEIRRLPGVTAVRVDLVPGGTSAVSVEADQPLDPADVRAAVDEAVYDLAGGSTS